MKCSLHILVADIDAEEVLTCLVRERWIEPLLKVSPEQIQQKIGQLERSFGLKPGCGKVRKPKELWRECFRHFVRPERGPRSGDLALAIKHANIDELRCCESFAKLHDTLCTWFPADNSF